MHRPKTLANHPVEIEHAPVIKAQAIGVHLAAMFMQTGEGADVDDGLRLAGTRPTGRADIAPYD